MSLRLLAILSLLAAPGWAQTTAIRAGHVIDPATGTVAHDQVILIEKGKITQVGGQVTIPAGATTIDLSGSWVLPGLMDAHAHLTLGLLGGEPFGANYVMRESSGFRALRGLKTAREVLEAGFTVIKDVGNSAEWADTDLRLALEKGWFAGPTLITTGKIIAPYGGQFEHIPSEQGPVWHFEYLDADSPDEVRRAVRQNIYYGATAIKLVCDQMAYYCSEEDVRAAVTEAHNSGLTVAIHVSRDAAARNVILGGADSIEHGFRLSDDVLKLMIEKGTVLVGTDFPYEHLAAFETPARARETSDHILDRLRRAHRLGVKMAFGTDVVVDFPGRTRGEVMLDYLAIWTAAGIPAPAILKAMTTNAAELLRIEKERGAIAAGLAADIIATPQNPLEDIQALRKVHFVMKDGKVIKGPAAPR